MKVYIYNKYLKNVSFGANDYYKYPTALAPLNGAGRLWHMVGTTSALYRYGVAPLRALGATSGRYNAPPMCYIS